MNRDNLIDEVGKIFPMCKDNAEDIADFIIEDRKRICEPITRMFGMAVTVDFDGFKKLSDACREVLQRAGLIGENK